MQELQNLESSLDFDLLFECLESTNADSQKDILLTLNMTGFSHSEYAPRHSEALAEESKNLDSNNTESKAESTPLKPLNLKALLDSLPTPPPQGWESKKLLEICSINEKTYNPSNDIGKSMIYIDIDSVGKGTGKIQYGAKIPCEQLPSRARRIADSDTVIISTVRPYLKAFAYLEKRVEDSIFSTGFTILKGKDNILYSKFLYYNFMFSSALMKQMEAKMTKASYPSINTEDIENLQIPLPPLQAQEQIVSAIEKVEKRIALIDSSLAILESKKTEIVQTMLEGSNEREREQSKLKIILKDIESHIVRYHAQKAMLGHFIYLILKKSGITQGLHSLLDSLPTPPPQGWERVRLDKIISLEYGKALQESKRIEGIYPVMGSNGIVGYHNEYLVKAPAIIVGRKGSAGKVTFIDKNCYPIDTTFYVLNKENNNFKMLFFILQSLNLEKSQGGIGVPGINRNDIYNIQIPLPPLESQEQIINVINTIEEKINLMDCSLESLEGKKSKILKNALE